VGRGAHTSCARCTRARAPPGGTRPDVVVSAEIVVVSVRSVVSVRVSPKLYLFCVRLGVVSDRVIVISARVVVISVRVVFISTTVVVVTTKVVVVLAQIVVNSAEVVLISDGSDVVSVIVVVFLL